MYRICRHGFTLNGSNVLKHVVTIYLDVETKIIFSKNLMMDLLHQASWEIDTKLILSLES